MTYSYIPGGPTVDEQILQDQWDRGNICDDHKSLVNELKAKGYKARSCGKVRKGKAYYHFINMYNKETDTCVWVWAEALASNPAAIAMKLDPGTLALMQQQYEADQKKTKRYAIDIFTATSKTKNRPSKNINKVRDIIAGL